MKRGRMIKLRVPTLNVGNMTSKEKWWILWNEEGWTYCVCRKPAGRGREQDAQVEDIKCGTVE